MPKRPRRSIISAFLQTGQMTPLETMDFSSVLMNLHLGKLEQAMKEPNLPSRVMSLPSLQSGQASPVSFGGSRSFPSAVRAPSHSGKREQEKKVPLRASLMTIGLLHLGHLVPLGASPILVTLSTLSLLFTSFLKGV